ncbi:hypothetical protein BB561_002294 [Smittium simulii]|uniref:Serine/threonine-protein phosphatase 2A activator n=1 Tax=Smittium simulii TaxID=133385 RepID=A0A2T9YR12_9FUNG|nr:hypothetical protein BB561_002294 [Smittium simulii]
MSLFFLKKNHRVIKNDKSQISKWTADTGAGTSCKGMGLELVYPELKAHINYVFKIRNRTYWAARRYTKSVDILAQYINIYRAQIATKPPLLPASISMRLVGKLIGEVLKLSSARIRKDPTVLCVKTTLATAKFLNAISLPRYLMHNSIGLVTISVEYRDSSIPEENIYMPQRCIFDISDMENWELSQAKADFLDFIEYLGHSVKGLDNFQEGEIPNNILKLTKILDHLDGLLEKFPPGEDSTQRYGNKNFREWFKQMEDDSSSLLSDLLESKDKERVNEFKAYFVNSFGNSTRIDYGSGHEMYLELVRKIQVYYKLEPAGSHGVWGLDDFQFLVYYFGSSQFIGTNLEPSMSINETFTKNGPFFEHSRQLYDVSGVHTWEKVNSGLLKMYKAEVLVKFPIIQHTLFGSLFSFDRVKL